MPLLGSPAGRSWQVGEACCDLRGKRAEPERPWRIAAEPQHIVVDPVRAGLVVVDMQNDFCHPAGWLASLGVDIEPARTPIRPLVTLLTAWRASGAPVIWCSWGNRPDLANVPPGVLHVYNPDGRSTGLGAMLGDRGPVLERGSWGAAIVDELEPAPVDLRVDKYRMSGFWDTPLDSILRNRDLTTVFFAGVNVDQCVFATLVDAACLGYDCVLLTDCAGTTSPRFCTQATVYNVRQCFGFTATSEAVLEGMG